MKLSYPKKLDIASPANRVCGVSIGKQVSVCAFVLCLENIKKKRIIVVLIIFYQDNQANNKMFSASFLHSFFFFPFTQQTLCLFRSFF